MPSQDHVVLDLGKEKTGQNKTRQENKEKLPNAYKCLSLDHVITGDFYFLSFYVFA